jgi:hypothetical protein
MSPKVVHVRVHALVHVRAHVCVHDHIDINFLKLPSEISLANYT